MSAISVAEAPDTRPFAEPQAAAAPAGPRFRVRAIMKQGTAASIPQVWVPLATLAEAREAVKKIYHDDRVMRAFIVTDEAPPRFVEWTER